MTLGRLRILALGVLFGIVAASAGAQQQRGDWWGHGPMGPGHMWSERMPGWGWGNMGPGQQQRMQRHWTYMNEGVPASYRGGGAPFVQHLRLSRTASRSIRRIAQAVMELRAWEMTKPGVH